jgi:putative PIN family toxin of toxin-antitoxin system
LISPGGTPARLFRSWVDGELELIVSELLLEELANTLEYPRIRARVTRSDADRFVASLRAQATLVLDHRDAPVQSADPADDYLLALAIQEAAALVSGDRHLLELAGDLPIFSPREFLGLLQPGAAPPDR